MNIEQSETTTTDEHNEHEDEWLRKDNNEYIKMFIENFNMKKMSFDGSNDDNLYRVIPM
jgi:hypothetical protein